MTPKNLRNNLLVILSLGMILAGCSSETAKNEQPVDQTTPQPEKEAVRVMKMDYQPIARSITYSANLQAYKEIHLAPASPGRIEKIYVEAGSSIKEGQLLVEMDQTQLRQAQVQLQGVETDYRRFDTLRRAESISQQQFDQIKTQYEVLLSNVKFLKENTKLTAPFNGKVSGKYFENGEMFSGAPNTLAGKAAILSIVQTDKLKVLVNISERHLTHIKTGMPVHFNTDVYPGESFAGKIIRI
ncbi:MAG: efflux RND transporter periplasmic adaptor subunit [Bacteroidales bacterium]|nr:efflux RND transporter periplasmic adaptor subunit [Bacteroidales bacterium]